MSEPTVVILTEENVEGVGDMIKGDFEFLKSLVQNAEMYNAEVYFAYDDMSYCYYSVSRLAKASATFDLDKMVREELLVNLKQRRLKTTMLGDIF